MSSTDGVRLRAQADVTLPRQRVSRMFQRLTKRGAAVASLAAQAGTHIQMRVQVNDADRAGAGDVAQVVAKGRLVTTAQNYRNSALIQNPIDDLTKGSLRLLQAPIAPNVATSKG